jgi:flagellar biosynthesis protein FlhG
MATIPDQADKLRRLVEEAQQSASEADVPLVVVCGGQRGVGASTIALQLALSSQGRKRRAIVVDASFREDNYYLPPRSKRYDTLVDVIAGGRTVSEVLHTGPHGLSVAPAVPLPAALSDVSGKTWSRVVGQLRSLRSVADLILVDGGAGATPLNTPLWAVADLVLLVAGPQSVSVMDAYAALKTASSRAAVPRVGVILNQSTDETESEAAADRIAAAAGRFLNMAIDVLPPIPALEELTGEVAAPRRLLKDLAVRAAFGQLAEYVWEGLTSGRSASGRSRRAA